MSAPGMQIDCTVCDNMSLSEQIDLNLAMGEVAKWPASVWAPFRAPKRMTAHRTLFGAMKVGQAWLAEHGYRDRFTRSQLLRHYKQHVTVIAADPMELLNRGIIEASDSRSLVPEKIDPEAFITYFNKGIQLGNRTLDLMSERLEGMVAKGEEIPMALLLKMADLGKALATTQATLRSRGLNMNTEDDGEEGFRAGSAPLPSPRVGHNRVRVVEGEARPVRDEGPADRAAYSERARQEGSPGLPS